MKQITNDELIQQYRDIQNDCEKIIKQIERGETQDARLMAGYIEREAFDGNSMVCAAFPYKGPLSERDKALIESAWQQYSQAGKPENS